MRKSVYPDVWGVIALLLMFVAFPATAYQLRAQEIAVPVEAEVQSSPKKVTAKIISRYQEQPVHPMDCIEIELDTIPVDGIPTIKYGCHPEPRLARIGTDIKTGKPFLIFQAGKPGSFGLFVSSYHSATNHLTKFEVITGGEEDNPPFPPDETPTPIGQQWVIIIYETKDKTMELGNLLENPTLLSYLSEKKHRYRPVDVTNQTAEWLNPYRTKIAKEGLALPVLALAPLGGFGENAEPYLQELKVVTDSQGNKSIPPEQVIDTLKKFGG